MFVKIFVSIVSIVSILSSDCKATRESRLIDVISRVRQVTKNCDLQHMNLMRSTSFSHVYSGFKKNQPIILKISISDLENFSRELECLKIYAQSKNSPKIFQSGDDFVIMQKLHQDTSLEKYFSVKDDTATSIICALAKRLHRSRPPKKNKITAYKRTFSGI